MLISVRNKFSPSRFSLESDLPYYAQYVHTDDPILFILMDLGTAHNEVVVHGLPKAQNARKNLALKKYLFGIHALGAGAKTYGVFQDLDLWHVSQKLFDQVIQTNGQDIRRNHDEICQHNWQFNYHKWESRVPVIQRYNLEQAEVELGEDSSMAGVE